MRHIPPHLPPKPYQHPLYRQCQQGNHNTPFPQGDALVVFGDDAGEVGGSGGVEDL